MDLDIIKQVNWVDIGFLILLLRICYIAMKKGFFIELFKLSGTILAIYIALHYYTVLSDFAGNAFALKEKIPLELLDFVCFIALAVTGYLVIVLFRETTHHFVKMEAAHALNKWGGFILGIARGFLVSGLILFILIISTMAYFKKSVGDSYLGRRVFKIAPATYTKIWNDFMSKFMTQEKFNKTILEVQEDFNP